MHSRRTAYSTGPPSSGSTAAASRRYPCARRGRKRVVMQPDAPASTQVVVCNTVPLPENKQSEKIVQLSIAEFLAQAIARIHTKQSVSELFTADFDEPAAAAPEPASAAGTAPNEAPTH